MTLTSQSNLFTPRKYAIDLMQSNGHVTAIRQLSTLSLDHSSSEAPRYCFPVLFSSSRLGRIIEVYILNVHANTRHCATKSTMSHIEPNTCFTKLMAVSRVRRTDAVILLPFSHL